MKEDCVMERETDRGRERRESAPTGEASQSPRTRGERTARKGKQVERLMPVITFLPGPSISKSAVDIKYPDCQKQAITRRSV